MSLNLDPRQRAMLLEMGIHVWQPQAPLAAPAPEARAAPAPGAAGDEPEPRQDNRAPAAPQAARPAIEPSAPAQRSPAPRPASAPVAPGAQPAPADASAAHPQPGWHLGRTQLLYADTAQAGGARWLVLAQTPEAALAQPVFQGDAGQLLDNMLRAARLDRAGAVLLAPLVRQGASAPAPAFVTALADLVAQARPNVVLVMGRLAALALLPAGEPFGKLRGRVHALHGASTIVTYDAPYLLRAPDDKAKAWADLCLALSLAPAGAPARPAG